MYKSFLTFILTLTILLTLPFYISSPGYAVTKCFLTQIGPNAPKEVVYPPGCESSTCSDQVAGGEKSTEELKQIYGGSPAEVEANLVSIDFQGKSIKVHKLVKGVFERVNSEITAANTGYAFTDLGTYEWRTKNIPGQNSPQLSTHSFGTTIDINPTTNPYTTASTHDIPPAVADSFKKNGFAWGGDWQPQHDWMHFQFEGTPGQCN